MRPRGIVVGAALAAATLVGVLMLAYLRHASVELRYDEGGSGCRELTAASRAELADALGLVRVLAAAWVVGTALGWGLPAAVAGRSPVAGGAGALLGVAIAAVLQLFVGAESITGLALVPLWLVAGLFEVGLAKAALAARARGRPDRPWLWAGVAWLPLAAGVLPLLLWRLTGNGEIRIC